MPGPTLTVDELAEELGRKPSWLYDHWRALCGKQRLPMPLQTTPPLVWDRAQVYAWKDRRLPLAERIAAAAYRAALAAAEEAHDRHVARTRLADSRRRLDERFPGAGGSLPPATDEAAP